MVDQIEKAEVAETKRSVFRAGSPSAVWAKFSFQWTSPIFSKGRRTGEGSRFWKGGLKMSEVYVCFRSCNVVLIHKATRTK